MHPQPLRFYRRGQIVTLSQVDSNRTLLDLLREDLRCSGTKEGCGEGDCGACTVVVGEEQHGRIQYSAVNSCIRLAHSIDGMALWTVEDLAPTGAALHPVQQAMLECHASQCGFCTPGFVMSLFGIYQRAPGVPISRDQAQAALSGNLCRCTGYRPILDAAQRMHTLPVQAVDEGPVLEGLRGMAADRSPTQSASPAGYSAPTTLLALLQARQAHPGAQLVAGATDLGLWLTKQHMRFAHLLDVTRAAELRQVEEDAHTLTIGAAVTLTEAFAAMARERTPLAAFADRFAGLPIRNAGTLGGNVANGSPIGDSMPLLIALGASVVLARASNNGIARREMPLEKLYTGYRSNCMAPDEILAWIRIPRPRPGELLRAYKVSKRMEDDISAVCLVVQLHIVNGVVETASIGVGGVAATPVRARATEASLAGKAWNQASVHAAMAVLREEFQPISDMRASAAYRRTVLGNLLQRFWLESQSNQPVTLEQYLQQGVTA